MPTLYECTADNYDFAFAFMEYARFNENRKDDHQHRPTPTKRLSQ